MKSILLDSKALTKIQSIILIATIAVAAISGGIAYVLVSGGEQPSNSIKIGVLADLDGYYGKGIWQGVVLAAEQLNAEGGILGRQIEVFGEDHDLESGLEMVQVSTSLTRLLTYHKVDFVIAYAFGEAGFVCQDIVAEHQKILLLAVGITDELTQRVLENYDKYKYFFRTNFNATSAFLGITDSTLVLRENTGFNKVGYLGEDAGWSQGLMDGLDYVLPEVYGFDLVYKGAFPLGTYDFSSYFAAAEEAGVEVLIPLIDGDEGIPFIKEYYDRQSPMMIYGGLVTSASVPESWEDLDGKCEHITVAAQAIVAGYPLTNKTLPTREAYIDMWGEMPSDGSENGYSTLKYILSDAINRAGTIETDKVIESLEDTNIETANARGFVFTSSHDCMVGENPNNPDDDYMLMCLFQWQNGELIPVYPKKIMEEAGATITFPPWSGPWDNIS